MHDPASLITEDTLFAFSYRDFLRALEAWKAEQLQHYPHQAERIEITALAMQDLMRSRHVVDTKLVVRQTLGRRPEP
jgi:hypothetical protein